ncbi:MAG TPA: protein kinase, partial [Kofleriaceae bacterium]
MAETDLSGTVLDGRYQVIEPIAEGAMGSVYRGERLKLGRAVAIKVMHQELPDELASRQRFEREAKLMALLEHPNCVSVIDFGLHEDKPFLVMDLVRGTSLLELLDKVGHLDIARSADIIRQTLSGLAHAHELGIVHRDIKPANIMISEKSGFGQQVRILDFGLARLLDNEGTKLTTGIVVGTPNYMAPEQCKGGDIDSRTDLYACGVMLFEMLTGRKPFVADDPIQVVRKHLMERPPTLASAMPNVDFGDFEAVVNKALSKSANDRFESAAEMAKAVEAAANKATKMTAAALFARAVPDTAPPIGSQQATMSGWNVPADGPPGAGHASPPPPASAPQPASPPQPSIGAAPPGATINIELSDSAVLPHSGAIIPNHDATTIDPRPAGASLPPLPQPAPYAPPPAYSTGPAPAVRSAQTGPVPTSAAPPTAGDASGPSTGAPNRSMGIPPTRPTAAGEGAPARDRPIPQLPLTKKQLLIAGGAVVGLIVIIAIASGGGAKKTETAKTGGGSAAVEEPKSDPVPQVIERANALIASEDYEEAVAVLKRSRKANPDNAQLAFLSGKANFARLWWSDGIDDFREAIKIDDGYKQNPELLKAVIKAFITTPDTDD